MNNVMLDLETLGTRPGSVILSIGAVFFDESGLGAEMHMPIRTESCVALGLTMDAATKVWWGGQSYEAQKAIRDANSDSAPTLPDALVHFSRFIGFGRADVRVWGNGSDFDNAMLAEAYRAAGMSQPWKFWNNRCYRTLKSIAPGPALKRIGTLHNALDDAKSQALHAIELFRANPELIL